MQPRGDDPRRPRLSRSLQQCPAVAAACLLLIATALGLPSIAQAQAPTNVNVASGNLELTVTWTAPNPAPSSYKIEYRIKFRTGGRDNPHMVDPATSGHVIADNLLPDNDYEVRVGAVDGGNTSWSSVVIGTTRMNPPVYTSGSPKKIGSDNIEVDWMLPPRSGSSPSPSAQIRYRQQGTGDDWKVLTNENGLPKPYTITNLAQGATYEVQVGAQYPVNPIHPVAWSASKSVDLTSVAPHVYGVFSGRAELVVGWKPVSGASSYTVKHCALAMDTDTECPSSDDEMERTIPAGGQPIHWEHIKGLTDDTKYRVVVCTGTSDCAAPAFGKLSTQS